VRSAYSLGRCSGAGGYLASGPANGVHPKIGTYAKLVDDRNNTAYPNGYIFYSEQSALDLKIKEILRVVAEIQAHSSPVIEHCYQDFLLQNHNREEREYSDPADQIREVLIHGNYLSPKDIEICLGCELSSLGDHPGYGQMRELHRTLQEIYGQL
jgi:hypothetical protein